ncbi:18846_t:CDS:2 [Gigaspora margarita]|uniref:18846_t:CDS:1 n=1 Tax=Gigaspora margarita TaxID=4874 RepID=A0ABN7W2T3_GIGMA|nr:18846_t:CDS:2 [Gigaspora margarita]
MPMLYPKLLPAVYIENVAEFGFNISTRESSIAPEAKPMNEIEVFQAIVQKYLLEDSNDEVKIIIWNDANLEEEGSAMDYKDSMLLEEEWKMELTTSKLGQERALTMELEFEKNKSENYSTKFPSLYLNPSLNTKTSKDLTTNINIDSDEWAYSFNAYINWEAYNSM